MKSYEIINRDGYCAVTSRGEVLWEGADSTELIDKLLTDLAREHERLVQLRQEYQACDEARDKAHRLIKEYYIPVVSRVTAFLKQLLKDDGNCAMLGRKHISDIRKLLGGSNA